MKLHIFLDNLQVHKTAHVKQAMERWGMSPIWNVPYRYDFQPIELVFSQVKHHFKKAKLNAFVNDRTFDYRAEVATAFAKCNKVSIVNSIRHAN